MKKTVFTLAAILLFTVNALAQNIPSADNAVLDKFLQSRITIKKVPIISDTLKKVITGNAYLVGEYYADSTSSGVLWEGRVIIKDGKMVDLEELSTSRKLKNLLSIVKKDFYFKTESDVLYFERMLDIFYPLSWSNVKYREHLKKDGKWYFVRGEFFENKEAVIVTMDASQKIIDISFSLEALKK